MEDLTTTSNSYSKDELAAMVRHPIVAEVGRILSLQSAIEELILDRDRSYNEIQDETKAYVDQMTTIWSLFGPSCAVARRLFPEHAHLFDMLDKSKSLKESFSSMAEGKLLVTETNCDKLCCIKQLS